MSSFREPNSSHLDSKRHTERPAAVNDIPLASHGQIRPAQELLSERQWQMFTRAVAVCALAEQHHRLGESLHRPAPCTSFQFTELPHLRSNPAMAVQWLQEYYPEMMLLLRRIDTELLNEPTVRRIGSAAEERNREAIRAPNRRYKQSLRKELDGSTPQDLISALREILAHAGGTLTPPGSPS